MIRQFIIFLCVLIPSFLLHFFALEWMDKAGYQKDLVFCYLFNGLMAFAIYFALYMLRKKFRDQLGFLFLLGSFLKFGGYFLFFKSSFGQDKFAFTLFFIPYMISLLVEVLGLVKILNSDD